MNKIAEMPYEIVVDDIEEETKDSYKIHFSILYPEGRKGRSSDKDYLTLDREWLEGKSIENINEYIRDEIYGEDEGKALMALSKHLDEPFNYIKDNADIRGTGIFEVNYGGREYQVVVDESVAIGQAEEIIKDNPDFLTESISEHYIEIDDTTKRTLANEDADSYMENISDEELIEDDYGYEETQTQIEDIEDKIYNLDNQRFDTEGNELENIDEIDSAIFKLEERKGELKQELEQRIGQLREEKWENYYDEVHGKLDDPIEYFVNEQGLYTLEELLNAEFVSIDYERAAEDVVRDDGWQHYLGGDFDDERVFGDYIYISEY